MRKARGQPLTTIVPDNESTAATIEGIKTALEELTPLVYDEVHRLAHQHAAREVERILQTSALINEASVVAEFD